MNWASTVIPLLAMFLLAGVWIAFVYPSTYPIRYRIHPLEAITVMGFYCLGASGLLLIYRSYGHVRNPNMKKACFCLFVGLFLILMSYWILWGMWKPHTW